MTFFSCFKYFLLFYKKNTQVRIQDSNFWDVGGEGRASQILAKIRGHILSKIRKHFSPKSLKINYIFHAIQSCKQNNVVSSKIAKMRSFLENELEFPVPKRFKIRGHCLRKSPKFENIWMGGEQLTPCSSLYTLLNTIFLSIYNNNLYGSNQFYYFGEYELGASLRISVTLNSYYHHWWTDCSHGC